MLGELFSSGASEAVRLILPGTFRRKGKDATTDTQAAPQRDSAPETMQG